MTTTTVYLAGPMTGLPDFNFPAFFAAAAVLRDRGYTVVSPAEINTEQKLTGTVPWVECLRNDIKALCDCEGIVLMPGWEGSKGAHLELHIAHRLGLQVMHFEKMTGGQQP